MASCTTCEQLVPRKKSADLGFSIALGAFLSTALLERALRGFLVCWLASLRVISLEYQTYI